MPDQRNVIFISHAVGRDDIFATWLSARLSMVGYTVWCDQQKLLGGEDFWKDIEEELRTKVAKFVLVISKNIRDESGIVRDGVAKEIALATALKKRLGDQYFIIPAVIDDTPFDEFGIEFIRLNGVDFRTNWATGLAKLIKVFERDAVSCASDLANASLQQWRQVHKSLARAIVQTEEILQSNWIPVESMPPQLNFFEIMIPLSFAEIRSIASECSLPCTDHGRLLAAFAGTNELQSALGESIPIRFRGALPLSDFLIGRTGDILGISANDARNKISSLMRQAWDRTMKARGLTPYQMANDKIAWWFPPGLIDQDQLRYIDLNGKPRRRAVIGIRGKKVLDDDTVVPRYHWHLGFTSAAFVSEPARFVLRPRIIISDDGSTPLENKTKLNSVRRAVTSMWFNDKWRGLVLGFCKWLANSSESIELDAGGDGQIALSASPMEFGLGVGIASDPAQIAGIPTDEDEEQFEEQEGALRLSDPAFSAIEEDDDDEEK